MYTYLKFGLPRVFPPNSGSQISRNRTGPNRGYTNRGYRDSSGPGPGSSGYDSSDNETTHARVPQNLRKYRSESDFRAINQGIIPNSRPSSRSRGNIPLAALKQANSRASIAGIQYMPNGKHYGNRSHSEADLLGGADGGGYEYDSRYNKSRLIFYLFL